MEENKKETACIHNLNIRCELCKSLDRKEYNRNYYIKNARFSREARRKSAKKYGDIRMIKYQLMKIDLIHYYSNKTMKCNGYNGKCPFESTDMRVLTLDHIDGKGYLERRKLGNKDPYRLYSNIIKKNYPVGYQILCFNCQHIKQLTNKEFTGRAKIVNENKHEWELKKKEFNNKRTLNI